MKSPGSVAGRGSRRTNGRASDRTSSRRSGPGWGGDGRDWGTGRMRRRARRAILSASGLLLAALVLAGSAGCGHVTPPQRPPPLGPEEGPIYDAGAPPPEADDEAGDGQEDDRR